MFPRGPTSRSLIEYETLIKSAASQFNRNNFSQAANLALQALRLIDHNFVNSAPTEKPGTLRFLAECHQKQGNFDKAIRNLQEATEILKKSLKGQKGELAEAILLELHNCVTNLGLAQIDEADRLVPEGTTNIPGRTFQLLEASKQHLLEAFGLTKSQLRNERQPSFGEWFYNYCSDLLNLVNVYVVEGEMFMEERCFRKIVQLVNKVERFYKEHSKEFKLKSVLSKCYYNKGVAYRVLKNYSEAEKYLKKDNSYCRKHGLTEELEKNRQEMYKLYVQLHQYEKALQYVDDGDADARRKIQLMLQNSKELKRDLGRFDAGCYDWSSYLSLTDKLLEFEFINPLINISQDMLRLHRQQMKQIELFQTHYRLAEAYGKQKQKEKCLEQLDQCDRFCRKHSREGLRAATLRLNIFSEDPNSEQLRVINQFKELMAVAKSIGDTQQLQILQGNLELYNCDVSYGKMVDPDISDDDDIFRRYARREDSDNRSRASNPEQDDDVQILDEIISQSRQDFKKVSSVKLSGQAYYRSKCVKHKLKANTFAISTIINRRPHELTGLANLTEKHLLILLKTISKPLKLDLRSHQLSNIFFEELNRQIDKKKIALIELELLAIDSRISSSEALARTIQHCINLQQLKLENCFIPQSYSLDYEGITVLKLRACRISDQALQSFPFSEMRALKSLSLRNNQLTSASFQMLNRLQLLNSLNLSNNPLGDSPACSIYLSPVVVKLKLREISFTTQLTEQLFDVIRGAKELDLSGCINPKLFFEAMFQRYIRQHYQLDIQVLRLNKLGLSEDTLNFIKSFLVSAAELQQLELRQLKHTADLLTDLASFIESKTGISRIDLRQSDVHSAVFAPSDRLLL